MSALIISTQLYEKRPLKKQKLGPPDVYPQDPKQKEDEITASNVKLGYNSNTVLQDEYGTARNANITPNRMAEYFNAILAKKQELNTLADTSRKKQQINKDSTMYVTSKTKVYVDSWFKDLASNTKSFNQLSRKVPLFNKKEEMFATLYEFRVPMFSAQWFLKISCAHQTALSESNNKSKKRQIADPSQEWTLFLCKFLKDHYYKITESINGKDSSNQAQPSLLCLQANPPAQPQSTEELLKQWNYYVQLAQHLYESRLLDRHEFLAWLLELFEKIKSIEDVMIHLVVPILVHFVDEFTQSELLSRRLAYHCAKRINQLLIDFHFELHNASNETDGSGKEIESSIENKTETVTEVSKDLCNVNTLGGCFKDIVACRKYRSLLVSMSAIIQVITLDCPTALVWLHPPSNKTDNTVSKSHSSLFGSPLDYLPCEPSNLPICPSGNTAHVRDRLRINEELIKLRSQKCEKKWFFETFEEPLAQSCQSWIGQKVNNLLAVLDALDRHAFDKVSSNNSLDTLYHRVFDVLPEPGTTTKHDKNTEISGKATKEIVEEHGDLVRLVCEWAVTSKRFGEHRSRVVAILLERRQSEINEREKHQGSESNEAKQNNEDKSEKVSTPIFQAILFDFLDNYAPVHDDSSSRLYGSNTNKPVEYSRAFKNLILLFSELIRFDVFSHDAYMRTLISRGLFANHPSEPAFPNGPSQTSKGSADAGVLSGLLPLESVSNGGLGLHKSGSTSSLPMFDPLSNNSNMHHNEQSSTSWLSMNNDNDEDNLDEDLDKILQNIKAGQQGLNDQHDILLPDGMESDREDDHGPSSGGANHTTSLSELASAGVKNDANSSSTRHLFYTLHFPLPQDEFYAHDCSQRHILLYGVGKAKDEARHSIKKVTKEILKLFNRKSSIDISEGGKVKKHVIREGFNFANTISKFQALSIFDQQQVTSSCAATVIEMLNGVGMGSSNHLPLVESIAFLFDLMEIALNVNGLIELVIHILKELTDVEAQLQQKCSFLLRPYYTSLELYIVGVLYRYHNYVVASNQNILAVFEGLWKIVRHINNPDECASAERCIFYFIFDLNLACSHVLKKYQETLNPVIAKIQAMSCTQNETHTNLPNTCVMMDYLKNPKTTVDASHIHELNTNPQQRYAFVFHTIRIISETTDMDQLNEMSVLCAELTALCSPLSNEWIEVFKALCCSAKTKNAYSPLLSQINIGDRAIYDNLAVFTSILVARRCFPVDEFIKNVSVPSLMLPFSLNPYEESERNARLSCHLMLYLFKYYDSPLATSNSAFNSSFASSSRYSLTSPSPLAHSTVAPPTSVAGQKPPLFIKYACDRYLLGGALNSLRIELFAFVFKAIFLLRTPHDRKNGDKEEMHKSNKDEMSEMNILGQITKSKSDDKPSLSDFAKHVLKQICSQDWVHDRCLRDFNPEFLSRLFIEKHIARKDAQQYEQLLNMICFHKQVMPVSGSNHLSDKNDPKATINRILQNLDEWSIRVSWLQLYFIYETLNRNSSGSQSHMSEVNQWLETLARSIVELFQNSSQNETSMAPIDPKRLTLFTCKSTNLKHSMGGGPYDADCNLVFNQEKIWLVGSLITKLPSDLQSKLLRVTASIFDSTGWIVLNQATSGSTSSKSKTFQAAKNPNNVLNPSGVSVNTHNPTSAFLSYQPFVSLLLMCLKSLEDDRNSLLSSLFTQISQCVNEKLADDIRTKRSIQGGLQLRFSLIGAMFETIHNSNSLTSDWSQLLAQLISYNIVDPHIHYDNFSSVLDMLTSLIHITHLSMLPEQREETKKVYQNLIKKLKKELNIERVTLGVRMAKQLLPITKQQIEVISCEPMGSLVDTKNNKIANFDSSEKKQGLQVADKIKLSAWDLLEGHKHPQPLSWTSFGGVRIERKPMRMEENFYLMARHNHSVRKPTSYYIEAPPLPPEEDTMLVQQQQAQQQNMLAAQQSSPMLATVPGPGGMHMGAYNGSAPLTPNNSLAPNCNMPSTPLLNTMISQASPTFNSPNMMHSMQQQQQQPAVASMGMPPGNVPQGMANNFHHHQSLHAVQHMHPMSNGGMANSNGMQPSGPMGPMGPGMHASNIGPGNAGPNNHLQGSQALPPPHHMIMNNHSSMMNMNMNMDNRDMMMDSLGPPQAQMMSNGPMHAIPPGMGVMRNPGPNSMNQVGPPQINPTGVTNVRAQNAKKPKAPRKRRPKAQMNGATPSDQQTPPIRMGNSFEYNQSVTPPVGQNNNWQYQAGGGVAPGGGPSQGAGVQGSMMGPGGGGPGMPLSGASGQQFYSQNNMQAAPGNNAGGVGGAAQPRFADPNINSKALLRAKLNTRHPNPPANQFNMAPNASGNGVPMVGAGGNMNVGGEQMAPANSNMMGNSMSYAPNPRGQMLMAQRASLRSQAPTMGGGGVPGNGAMFQQQQHHHMQQSQQLPSQSNFGGNQSTSFNASGGGGGMQGMEPQGNNFPSQQQQQQPMRPQMVGNQQQFMQQRSQYSNMGQQNSMGHSFTPSSQQQGQPNQSMMGSGAVGAGGAGGLCPPPSGQAHWQSQMGQQQQQSRQPMTQLQRQLSSNQSGPLPVQPGHATPYHQVQY